MDDWDIEEIEQSLQREATNSQVDIPNDDLALIDELTLQTTLALQFDSQDKSLFDHRQECILINQSLAKIIVLFNHLDSMYSEIEKISFRINYALGFLNILQDQFTVVIELLSDAPDMDLVATLKAKHVESSEFFINANSMKEINLHSLSLMNHVFTMNTLKHLIRIGNQYILDHMRSDVNKLIDELKIYNSHLNILIRIFASAIDLEQDDLICQSRSSPSWTAIQQVSTYVKLTTDPEQIQRSYYNFMKFTRLGHATFLKKTSFKNPIIRDLIFVGSIFWYFLLDSRANSRAVQHICEMRVDSAMSVMNLIEKPGIKHIIQLGISPIKTNFKVYIDPIVLPITLASMKEEFLAATINKVTQKTIEFVNLSIHNDPNYPIFVKNKSKLRIRVLSCQSVQKQSIFDQLLNTLHPGGSQIDTIILHFHGGGFIAMSSSSHQNYTREWANQLNVPIFSVDYSLSPEYKYPVALDDCWQAYNWILHQMSRYFNITPQNIILAGDSAGGNLCCALTALCIKYGQRVPDGMLISYPVLNLKLRFSPSHLNGLEDFLLSHTLMDICIEAYTGQADCFEEDPFRSPNHLSDEILKRFPPVRILCGTKDPLLDQSHRLIDRLLQNGRDVKVRLYEGMSHGFLNFYLLGGMRESEWCVVDSIMYLRELIHLSRQE